MTGAEYGGRIEGPGWPGLVLAVVALRLARGGGRAGALVVCRDFPGARGEAYGRLVDGRLIN